MKIIIIGSEGQLGSELQETIKTGHSSIGSIPLSIKEAEILSFDIKNFDISDYQETQAFIKPIKPDIIINCAAYTNVDACEEHHDTAFRSNAIGPRNLAIVADQLGAKLIHISTDYVFDGNQHIHYREWNVCNPQSIYGYSKYLGEQYVRDFSRRYFIIRTSWLYGKMGGNFVKTILRTAREKGVLKVVDDQRGTPTYAGDLAHHILKLADTEEYGVYHCTGNGECSWYEFACEIINQSDIQCKITPCSTDEYSRPAKRPAYSSLDNMMLRCTVGDEMRNWREALKSYMEASL